MHTEIMNSFYLCNIMSEKIFMSAALKYFIYSYDIFVLEKGSKLLHFI